MGKAMVFARSTDPITSDRAAESLSIEACEDSEREVLIVLGEAVHAINSESIVRQHEMRAWHGLAQRRYSESRIRTALSQLADKGWVVTDGTCKTSSGRTAQAWRLR